MSTLQDNLLEAKNDLESDVDQYLTFALDDEIYGMDIKNIDDIIGIQKITEVPNQPVYLKGVINLRGIIIPVIDIRIRFQKEERPYDDRTCIIVINIDDAAVGIVVDTVLEVIKLNLDDIADPPVYNDEISNQYMKGIGKHKEHVVIMVDAYALIKES
jgi:purine-binding chemotaxis protein CheW